MNSKKDSNGIEVVSTLRNIFIIIPITTTILLLFNDKINNIVVHFWTAQQYNNKLEYIATYSIIAANIFFIFKIKKYRSWSQNILNLILFTCSTYSLYRFDILNHNQWSFIPIFSSNIFYFDFIYSVSFSYILVVIFNTASKQCTPNFNQTKYGEPIKNTDEDLYEYEEKVLNLLNKLKNAKYLYTKSAITIGVIAPWGKGKTSFLNIINQLTTKGKYRNDFIFLNYNPWYYSGNPELITNSFFNKLKLTLSKYDPDLSLRINQYAQGLIKSNLGTISKIIHLFISTQNKSTNEDLHNQINEKISRIGTPIIIAIDDLDRLDSTEIMSVLKLVRNTANFKNIIFMLAYDEHYLIESFKENKIPKSDQFLEKIVNIPYYLPLISPGHEDLAINTAAKGILQDYTSNNIQINAFIEAIRSTAPYNFSLRKAVRFIYATCCKFENTLTGSSDQICLYDLLILEYAKSISTIVQDLLNRFTVGKLLENAPSEKQIQINLKKHIKYDEELVNETASILHLLNFKKYKYGRNSQIFDIINCPYRAIYDDMYVQYIKYRPNSNAISQNEFDHEFKQEPTTFVGTVMDWSQTDKRKCLFRLLKNCKFENQEQGVAYMEAFDGLYSINNFPLLGENYLFSENETYRTKDYISILEIFFHTYSPNKMSIYKRIKHYIDTALDDFKITNSNLSTVNNTFFEQHISSIESINNFNPDFWDIIKNKGQEDQQSLLLDFLNDHQTESLQYISELLAYSSDDLIFIKKVFSSTPPKIDEIQSRNDQAVQIINGQFETEAHQDFFAAFSRIITNNQNYNFFEKVILNFLHYESIDKSIPEITPY